MPWHAPQREPHRLHFAGGVRSPLLEAKADRAIDREAVTSALVLDEFGKLTARGRAGVVIDPGRAAAVARSTRGRRLPSARLAYPLLTCPGYGPGRVKHFLPAYKLSSGAISAVNCPGWYYGTFIPCSDFGSVTCCFLAGDLAPTK